MRDLALVHYHEAAPAPALRPLVHAYWTFRAALHLDAPYPHRVMPDGCANVVCYRAPGHPPRLFYAGPALQATEVTVPPGAVYRGVRLRPGAAAPLLHLTPAQLRQPHLPLAPLHPSLAEALLATLPPCIADDDAVAALDRLLVPFADAAAPLDAVAAAAVAEIAAAQGNVHVDALAARLGLSTRQLQRRFGRAVGLTPKQFARIRRFREAVSNVLRHNPDAWGRIAAECGFADQAHMTREFNALYGQPPGTLEQTVRTIEHGPVQP